MASNILKGDAKKLGFIHPESRKAAQIRRSIHKGEKKSARERTKGKRQSEQGHFFKFLQQAIERPENAAKKNFSYTDVVEILVEWATRFDDELQDLKDAEKKLTREIEVQLLVDEENQKLRTGYACPDLRVNRVVRELREWNGDFDEIARFKMVQFKHKPEANAMDIEEG